MHRALLHRAFGAATATTVAGLLVLGMTTVPAVADPGHGRSQGRTTSEEPADPHQASAGASSSGTAAAPSSSGAASVKASDRPPSAGGDAPPGNNGTIKIETAPTGGGQANHPHVPCQFWVSFFGYDAGTQTARLVFEGHAPTRGPVLLDTTTTWSTASRTGGNQIDTTYGPVDLTQAFAAAGMAPHGKQGFHVALTVHVTGSQGSDVKHKVFWVKPCGSTSAAGAANSSTSPSTEASISTTASGQILAGTAGGCTCSPLASTVGSSTPAGAVSAPAPAAGGAQVQSLGAAALAGPTPASARAAGAAAPQTAVLGATVTAPVVSGGGIRPATVAAATATRTTGALPFTGSNTKPLVIVALGLLAIGASLWFAARRRTA